MPSKIIIPSCAQIVQEQLIPTIPSRWTTQFRFGVHALTLKPFMSLASNARQTVANPDTASTKMDRLIQNAGLAETLGDMVSRLGLVQPSSLLNCDHSDFNGLMAFVGAVQTHKGRAIPCLVETTYSPRLPAHEDAPKRKQEMRAGYMQLEYSLYDQALSALEELAGRLGFWPRLVFDRGFGGLPFIRPLVKHGATFYVRIKQKRIIELNSEQLKVCDLPERDTVVILDGLSLRVIRSDDPETGEPWYILTSDFSRSRKKIIRIYYHRFEIEETFKDLKHVLDLVRTRLMKPLSLKLLIWFASLSFILAYLSIQKSNWRDECKHPKKKLSLYRQFFEALERETKQPICWLITGGNEK